MFQRMMQLWFDVYGNESNNNNNIIEYFVSNETRIGLAVIVGGILAIWFFRMTTTTTKSVGDEVQSQQQQQQQQQQQGNYGSELVFHDIKLTLSTKHTESILLNGSVWGHARPGALVAILGPSGAGKSSLLHALAGRIKYSSKLSLSGRRIVNGIEIPADAALPFSALVEQDVSFFPHMTVRETLVFRVQLKLGLSDPMKINEIVVQLLETMDLLRTADTIVGGGGNSSKVRGISGGEKKRLSIAVEIITMPSILFLDEPTSGLDSTSALQVVRILRKLANCNNNHNNNSNKRTNLDSSSSSTTTTTPPPTTTIVAVLHQPNQHVFDMFDDVLLLGQSGQQMYFGERRTVRHYLEQQGQCLASSEIGTAEHCLDCISSFPMNEDEICHPHLVTLRMERLSQLAAQQQQQLEFLHKKISSSNMNSTKEFQNNKKFEDYSSSSSGRSSTPKASWLLQFQLLFQRSLREILRSKLTIILYVVRLLTMALIYGSIYQLQRNQASIQDRFGLLSLIVIGAANMGMSKTIRSFPREKSIVATELAANLYNTFPYFVGKAISEIPLTTVLNSIFGISVYYMTGLDQTNPVKLWNFLLLLTMHGIVSEGVGLVIGSISPNSDVALAMYPAVVVLNIIFDGKNISEENIPRLLRWIPKIGMIRWSYEGLCRNEFHGLLFDSSSSSSSDTQSNTTKSTTTSDYFTIQTGAEALERFGLFREGERTIQDVLYAQFCIAITCWLLSYIGLTLTRQKFLIMKAPTSTTVTATTEPCS